MRPKPALPMLHLPGWRWLALLWLCLAAPVTAGLLDRGDAYFETVGDAEQIPDHNITALAQDQQGFIWIGTPSGLIRYDGYRFRRFELQPDGAASARARGVFVRTLLVARDGRLWMGTDADGLWVFDPVRERFRSVQRQAGVEGGLLHDNVRALAEDIDGSVWIGTRSGLNRWRADRTGDCPPLAAGQALTVSTDCKLERFPQRLGPSTSATDERILSLLQDAAGELLVGSWNGLSRRRADGSFERLFADPQAQGSLAGLQLLSLTRLLDGRVAVGTAQDGAFLIDAEQSSLLRIPSDSGATGIASYSLVMLQPRPEELWMGGFGGIAVLDAASGRLLRALRPDPAVPGALAHDQVRTMLLDRAGQVWIGGYGGGLQRHDPGIGAMRVLHHSPSGADSLSSATIGAVLELANGEIWIGTRDNGIDRYDPLRGLIGGWRAEPDNPDGLSHPLVQSLAQTRDGAVWVGTLAELHRYDPALGRFERFQTGLGLSGNTARRLLAGRDGRLWIGSNAGLYYWEHGATGLIQIPDSRGQRASADVNALAEAADGRIWVGTNAGLFSKAAGEAILHPVRGASSEDDRLARLTIVGMLMDAAGQLWIDGSEGLLQLTELQTASDCGQLSCAPAVRLRSIGRELGLAAEPVGANLLQDRQGRLWTQRYVIDPAAGTVHELTRADGVDIGTAWFRSYTKTRDGLLLFGGNRGLLVVDPERFRPWAYQPPLVISELRVDGRSRPPLEWVDGLVLQAEQRSLNVEFAALDFSAPQRNQYRYRLSGFDQDWITTDSSRRLASYSNLWPGRYELQVEASNRAGQWVEQPLLLPVQVLPAFWQTGWFLGLMLGLTVALIMLWVRRHTARLRAHERELEATVKLRTKQLQLAKEHAESALEQLQSAQRHLVAAEKMASLGQLVAGVAHEINTPLGTALTAASHLDDEVRGLRRKLDGRSLRQSELGEFLNMATEAGELVNRNLGRAAQLVRSFKQVSADRSSDERRLFLLADSLSDLCENLQLSWKPRLIELALRCPPDLRLDSYPGTIGQIITTLAGNALLHAFAPEQCGRLQIDVQTLSADRVRLSFSDDGRGIAETDLARVFEPFYTTRRADGCIGLGLHTAFNLVRARLGGQIEVFSVVGQGTRFVLEFPRVAPAKRAEG
jgi:ligand-binding sensor domain-containing protein/signal transduction histidine kinase